MRLRIKKEYGYDFSFLLISVLGKHKGIIRASYYEGANTIELTYFWVNKNYRKRGWGKRLLNALKFELKNYPNIKTIEVVPIPHEENDSDIVMEINELYKIYSRLGFEFKESNNVVPYKSRMILTI